MGAVLRASAAQSVVSLLIRRAAARTYSSLISEYEATLYGSDRVRSTNGYEQRRQAALMAGPTRLRAAAAASAVAFVQTRLKPGESTDGAVFFPTDGKPLDRAAMSWSGPTPTPSNSRPSRRGHRAVAGSPPDRTTKPDHCPTAVTGTPG